MRIACNAAQLGKNRGSGHTAMFILLNYLLDQGFQFDYFGLKPAIEVPELESHPNFKYYDMKNIAFCGLVDQYIRKICKFVPPLPARLFSEVSHRYSAYHILRKIKEMNKIKKYDCLLYIQRWAPGKITGLPTLSYIQGPPGTDARANLRAIRHISIWKFILDFPLICISIIRIALYLPNPKYSDGVICNSNWSAEEAKKILHLKCPIYTVPFAIDLELFKPSQVSSKYNNSTKKILWLGRIVKRKRFDLFLGIIEKSFELKLNVEFTIVGHFEDNTNKKYFIDLTKRNSKIKYIENLKKEEVADILKSSHILIQPGQDESLSSSVAEATACGVLSLIGPSNGTAEYLPNELRSLMANNFTLEEFWKSFLKLYSLDSSDFNNISQLCRAKAIESHSVQNVAETMTKVLSKIIKNTQSIHSP